MDTPELAPDPPPLVCSKCGHSGGDVTLFRRMRDGEFRDVPECQWVPDCDLRRKKSA